MPLWFGSKARFEVRAWDERMRPCICVPLTAVFPTEKLLLDCNFPPILLTSHDSFVPFVRPLWVWRCCCRTEVFLAHGFCGLRLRYFHVFRLECRNAWCTMHMNMQHLGVARFSCVEFNLKSPCTTAPDICPTTSCHWSCGIISVALMNYHASAARLQAHPFERTSIVLSLVSLLGTSRHTFLLKHMVPMQQWIEQRTHAVFLMDIFGNDKKYHRVIITLHNRPFSDLSAFHANERWAHTVGMYHSLSQKFIPRTVLVSLETPNKSWLPFHYFDDILLPWPRSMHDDQQLSYLLWRCDGGRWVTWITQSERTQGCFFNTFHLLPQHCSSLYLIMPSQSASFTWMFSLLSFLRVKY